MRSGLCASIHVQDLYINKNNNQAVVAKLWGWLWMLNRLIKFGFMHSAILS